MSLLETTVDAARAHYASNNPKSLQAFNFAAEALPGGGTRSSIFIHPFPLFIAKGVGSKLIDLDGHEYTDFVSDFTSGIYGKTNPLLRDAIVAALDNGIQLGAHTTSEAKLASLIKARFPSIDLVRFANSGTEANMLALATAQKFTGRSKILVFEGGYHGSLLSHFHVTASETSKGRYESNVLTAPFDFIVGHYNDATAADTLIREHASNLAAVIVEPMLGAGGCIPADPQFLQQLRESTAATGVVLIFDEVQTARLGPGGRQELLQIRPDMTTVGKFFGGGFAFGAFGGKREIMSMFDSRKADAVSHGGTFNNSILTMTAGAVALEHILLEPAVTKLNALGDELRNTLNTVFKDTKAPFHVTGLGSINQINCTLQSSSSTFGMDLLFYKLLEQGFWIAQRGLLSLSFETTTEEVKQFTNAVKKIVLEAKEVFAV